MKPRTEPADCFRLVTVAVGIVSVMVLVIQEMCDLMIVLVLRGWMTCA